MGDIAEYYRLHVFEERIRWVTEKLGICFSLI